MSEGEKKPLFNSIENISVNNNENIKVNIFQTPKEKVVKLKKIPKKETEKLGMVINPYF